MTAIRATFEDVKRVKTRKVWQLIFEVPEENYDAAIQALGGSPQSGTDRWVGIAPVTAPDAPVERVKGGERSQRAGTEGWSEAKRKMVQRSGIVRREDAFQRFLATGWPGAWNSHTSETNDPSEAAAGFIHQYCCVESCRDLDPTKDSGDAFSNLMDRYGAWIRIAQEGRSTPDLERQKGAGP